MVCARLCEGCWTAATTSRMGTALSRTAVTTSRMGGDWTLSRFSVDRSCCLRRNSSRCCREKSCRQLYNNIILYTYQTIYLMNDRDFFEIFFKCLICRQYKIKNLLMLFATLLIILFKFSFIPFSIFPTSIFLNNFRFFSSFIRFFSSLKTLLHSY